MAKIVLKCPYYKAGKSVGGYVRHIALRDGVEKPNDEKAAQPAIDVQKRTVERLLREISEKKYTQGLRL